LVPTLAALTDEQNESNVANDDGIDGRVLYVGFGIGKVEISGVSEVRMFLINSEVQKEERLPWLEVINGENMVVPGGVGI
jgi:hypothetical protein